MPVGYSNTPLHRKLGITEASQVAAIDKPADYESLLGGLPDGATIVDRITGSTTLVHLFVVRKSDLVQAIASMRDLVGDGVPVWVSWPKKTSKVETDLTEDTLREVALPLGWVDVKVCAVSEVWSALKLVVRKSLRTVGNGP